MKRTIISRGHRALNAAERGLVRLEKFRWWLADRIRPIPTNGVIRDRDEARRWISESEDHVPDGDEQKAMDAFSRLQDDAHMLDEWRRGDWDTVLRWDAEDQRLYAER